MPRTRTVPDPAPRVRAPRIVETIPAEDRLSRAVSFNVSERTLARVDALVRPGRRKMRSDRFRQIIEAGLAAVEKAVAAEDKQADKA